MDRPNDNSENTLVLCWGFFTKRHKCHSKIVCRKTPPHTHKFPGAWIFLFGDFFCCFKTTLTMAFFSFNEKLCYGFSYFTMLQRIFGALENIST